MCFHRVALSLSECICAVSVFLSLCQAGDEEAESGQKRVGAMGESEVEKIADHMHFAIFPEEYDHFYDTEADSKKRQAGINPLSDEYTHQANERRIALGFAPYDPITLSSNSDTKEWVKTLISAGRAPELAQHIVKVQAEPLSRSG